MVDDYFAEGWPGVSEGVHAFMLHHSSSGTPKVVPFFVGFNKVLFSSQDFSGGYQDALMSWQNIIGLVC
jgi:hypothetical protein